MNLIEMLKNEISGSAISSLSQKVGVSEDQVKTGLSAGIPAVLTGIVKNGIGAGSGFLDNVLPGYGADSKPEDVLSHSDDSLLEKGKSMLDNLFGNNSGAITNAVSSASGLSTGKAADLLAMAAPLITGSISKLMANKGWSTSDLLGKISESKADIAAALPHGLGDFLDSETVNVPDLNMNTQKVETPKVKVPPITYSSGQETKSGGGFLKWLIGLLIIAIGAWWLMSRSGCNHKSAITAKVDSISHTMDSAAHTVKEAAASTTAVIAGKLNEAGDFVRDLGAAMKKKLPDGTEITIAENSVENRLISFIEDKNKMVDKTTWFTFDRLYFETGKNTLKFESQQQLKNIAAILKAYPNVHLKLGGYTDNTGDAAINKKLSNERASTAMKELIKLGVDSKRLEAEGYGADFPIASNDTAEGRAQNRRIDIRVTQK
jgi:OmpA-OmpF porin, OOP family